MLQRGTMSMTLFFLAALVVFSSAIYDYTHGRGVDWKGILIGAGCVLAGVYFKTVKRPT
jgi:hypothetical protein